MQMVWGIKTGKIGCMDNRLHGCMKRSRKTKDNFHFLCMQIGKIYCCGKGRWDYCTKKEKEPQYLVFNILVHTKYRGFHSNKKSSDAFLTGGQPSCECLLQCRCNIGTAIAGAAIVVPFSRGGNIDGSGFFRYRLCVFILCSKAFLFRLLCCPLRGKAFFLCLSGCLLFLQFSGISGGIRIIGKDGNQLIIAVPIHLAVQTFRNKADRHHRTPVYGNGRRIQTVADTVDEGVFFRSDRG